MLTGWGGEGSVSPWRDPRKATMLTGTILNAVLCAASGCCGTAGKEVYLLERFFSEGAGLQDF